MSTIIDARGLPCPQPVMKTKKGLDSYNEITVIVDNETAASNVRMFAKSRGCDVDILPDGGAEFHIHIKSNSDVQKKNQMPSPESYTCETSDIKKRNVIVLSSNIMGKGDDKLGEILLKAFIHTVTEADTIPDTIILYNSGVKLAVKGAVTSEDLSLLESKGVKILVCGTCVKYFNLENEIGAGIISNMFDIVTVLSSANGIIMP